MMSLFEFGKKLLNKYPKLTVLAVGVHNVFAGNFVIGIRGNKIIKNKSFLKKCKIKICGNGNQIVLGEKCFLSNCNISISGNNNRIVLNSNVYIDKCDFNVEDDRNTILINDGTRIFGRCELAVMEGTQINIGRDCLFSSMTTIRTGDSHSVLDLSGNRINHSKDINIGDRVWIGQKASILKDAEISNNSIVAFGTIVTRKFDKSNVVIAGVPGKIVKEGVNWCKPRL